MLNTRKVQKYAEKMTPNVKINFKNGWMRHDVVNLLSGSENIGIELGVAEGIYAKRIIKSEKFKRFYGVDVYGDTHDTAEYARALRYIGFQNPSYCLLRMDFDSALDLFDDSYFDFIYIDGFAHTGEEGGKTLVDWYNKLKTGGILAGDDYHDNWPLVKWAVNDLVDQLGVELNITTGVENVDYSMYPTWYIKKTNTKLRLRVNQDLYAIAIKEKKRIHSLRVGTRRKIIKFIGHLLHLLGLKEIVKRIRDKLR